MSNVIDFSDMQFEHEQTNEWKAQDLVYDAWEIDSTVQRKRLARKALELDPLCADAYSILAEEYESFAKKEEYYQKGIQVFRERYDEKYFEENTGAFWGLLETRPFMRLSSGYGQLLWDTKKYTEAIKVYEDLLLLCPNDNLGLRYILVLWLIDQNFFDKAKKIFKTYLEDTSASMLYSELLFAIKERESDKKIAARYSGAYKANPFVVEYLLNESKLPDHYPEYFKLGSEEEAVEYYYTAVDIWKKDPYVLEKLKRLYKD